MTIRGENASRQRLRYRPDSDLTIELSWYGLTDVGLRRDNNQDSFVVAPPLFAVADGMGGHAAGEVASAAVVRRLAELGGDELVSVDDLSERLIDAIEDIELEVGEAGLGAGTTVTGAVFGGDVDSPSWTVFNIGDSRVYQYFKGALSQITVDHSVVQHLIDTGAITPEEAEVHPHANVITRAVGFNEDPIPDTVGLALIPGQRLLICSDGLTKELTDLGVQHFLSQARTAEEAAKLLMSQALGNAGRDNVTAVVIDVHAVGDVRDTSDIHALDNEDAREAVAQASSDAETDAASSSAGHGSDDAADDGENAAESASSGASEDAAGVTCDMDDEQVYVGTERVEHLLAGNEVSAARHVGGVNDEQNSESVRVTKPSADTERANGAEGAESPEESEDESS
jgi:serine/threonine protein phosphatase PrpC